MYIQPNTTIKFLQNIPFDADYNDTVYFYPSEGQAGQAEYFDSFTKYTINENYYQRVNKGELKVQLPYSTGVQYESTAEKLYDCNYMMFRNTNFGNKWFYAFIKNVEWVNNETAKITYELDVMQTWFFDYDLEQCFVEREHSATDEVGDNLVPENLELGYEMVEQKRIRWRLNTDSTPESIDECDMGWGIVMLASKELHGNYPLVGIIAPGTLSSLQVYRFFMGDFADQTMASHYPDTGNGEFGLGDLTCFQNTLYQYTRANITNLTPDEIVLLYLCPMFINNNNAPSLNKKTVTFVKVNKIGDTVNGYVPNNKKLLTHPYVQLLVTNHSGNTQSYKFEYFNSQTPGTIKFNIIGQSLYSPSLVCIPENYIPSNGYGTTEPTTDGIDYGVVISDFPQMAWTGDTFKAWWAQNKNSTVASTALGTLSGAITAIAGGALMGTGAGSPIGAAMIGTGLTSIGGSIGKTMAKVNDTKNAPPIVNGLSSTSYLLNTTETFGYDIIQKSITPAQAKIIDDYFTMFGYACHEVKTPNRHARPHWTYTQTVGCTIKARCPGDDQKKICQIYDKGIRFWSHDTNTEIGKYYNANGTPIDNSPTAG